MDYGYILDRAWRITWAHKTLWLFAFLAGLGAVSYTHLTLPTKA